MRLTRLVLSLGCVVCLVGSGVADEPEPVLKDAALRQILQERIKNKKTVGIVVGRLEGTNRSIVAAGTMSLTNSRPVDGDTVFEIGSITKVFTGTLLADMANRGEVQPNDPATKYLPPTAKMPSRNGKVITLAHLASHRSGLPRELGNRPPGEYKPSPAYSPELVFEFLSGTNCRGTLGAFTNIPISAWACSGIRSRGGQAPATNNSWWIASANHLE